MTRLSYHNRPSIGARVNAHEGVAPAAAAVNGRTPDCHTVGPYNTTLRDAVRFSLVGKYAGILQPILQGSQRPTSLAVEQFSAARA
jgi:hypothetical protein